MLITKFLQFSQKLILFRMRSERNFQFWCHKCLNITKCLRWRGTSGGYLIQFFCPKHGQREHFAQACIQSGFVPISKNGHSTISVSNFFPNSDVSAILPNFLSSADLLRVHAVPSSGSLMKMLNSISLSVDSLHTPVVTGLQVDFVQLIITLTVMMLTAWQFGQFSVHLTVHLSSLY